MDAVVASYLPIIIFLVICAVIGGALMIAPFVIAYKNPDPEKLSAYECGFNAFDDARMKFDVRFYLVSILFIIFDLEVAFLFPWAVSFIGCGGLSDRTCSAVRDAGESLPASPRLAAARQDCVRRDRRQSVRFRNCRAVAVPRSQFGQGLTCFTPSAALTLAAMQHEPLGLPQG